MNKSTVSSITLPLSQGGERVTESVLQITGHCPIRNIVKLIEIEDLDANPRSAKKSDITDDILDTLENDPGMYPVLSQGITIASSDYEVLDRDFRFRVRFHNRDIEGVINGGHNLLALMKFVLGNVISSTEDIRKLRAAKNWSEAKKLFRKYHSEVNTYVEDPANLRDLVVPVELLVPKDDGDWAVSEFRSKLPEIQDARNTNSQLTQSTKMNQEGLYDFLRSVVDPDYRENVEWKDNTGGPVKAPDIVQLAWIPLSVLMKRGTDVFHDRDTGKEIKAVDPRDIYNSKAKFVRTFSQVMKSPDVSTQDPESQKYVIHHEGVRSALTIAGAMPGLYEAAYEAIPRIYNAGGGHYGSVGPVKEHRKTGKAATKKYSQDAASDFVPNGYLIPFLNAFQALLNIEGGKVVWKVDPFDFLHDKGDMLGGKLRAVIEDKKDNPQDVGKSGLSYAGLYEEVERVLTSGS